MMVPARAKAKAKPPKRSIESPTWSMKPAPANEPAPPRMPAAVEILVAETSAVKAR
jgi:hypothetical protein